MNEHIDLTHIEFLAEDTDLESALKTALVEARANIEAKNRIIEMADQSLTNWREKVEAVTELVQAEFDKGGWDEDDEFFQGLCRHLDIETTVETQVTVTAIWNITVRHPKGYDVENELSTYVHLEVEGMDCDIDEDNYPDVEVSAN